MVTPFAWACAAIGARVTSEAIAAAVAKPVLKIFDMALLLSIVLPMERTMPHRT